MRAIPPVAGDGDFHARRCNQLSPRHNNLVDFQVALIDIKKISS
jgi:hypothetical protein